MQRIASHSPGRHRTQIAACAAALLALGSPALAQRPAAPAPATTLDRIRETGQIRLGYRTEARPFSYQDEAGAAAGYAVELCLDVVTAIKAELGLTTLGVEWVPVTLSDRFQAVQQGRIDLLCGAATETLGRRAEVAFSLPIFPDGVGALLRRDAASRLREALSGQQPSTPQWRASAYQMLQTQTFAMVPGTTAEPWLAGKLSEFQLTAEVVSVDGYEAGIQAVLDRKADVLFGDRAILLDAATRAAGDKLAVLDRFFTYELVGLALARDDDAFRLLVDRTLSRLYAAAGFSDQYAKWFGKPDERVLTFFRWNTLPE